MRLKILGKISPKLKRFLSNLDFTFEEETSEADYFIVSSDIKSYFLNTEQGKAIAEAYDLEFSVGKPKVIKDSDFMQTHKNHDEALQL